PPPRRQPRPHRAGARRRPSHHLPSPREDGGRARRPRRGTLVRRAGLLAPLLVVAAALPACLISQEDHIIQPLPPAKNQPPRILEVLLQPPGRFFTSRNGLDCPNLFFSAKVADPDVNDTLFYNFYVDANVSPAPVKQSSISNPSKEDVRVEAATYEFSFATVGALQQPGDHVVELLLADGPLINGQPQPRLL